MRQIKPGTGSRYKTFGGLRVFLLALFDPSPNYYSDRNAFCRRWGSNPVAFA